MSFFKRLKDKFSSKSEDEIQKELTEDVESDETSDSDASNESGETNFNDTIEEPKPKKKPKKLSEADFDEDGLISIEDFEEIEAQKIGAKFKAVSYTHLRAHET